MLRLQKYLSECGVCSRRHAEDAIKNGEVIVNGQVAQIGQSINPEVDKVEFSGKLVNRSDDLVYYAMNKPRGIETTCAQKDGKSIIDIIDTPTRIFPIGRLDKDSSGLILLTNDGRLTHRLLHPSFEHQKEYVVTTYGKIDDRSLEQMAQGVRYSITEGPKTSSKDKIQDTKWRNLGTKNWQLKTSNFPKKFVQTQPCEIRRISSDTFRIVLTEGKNRQIRRMVEACGHQVKKLKRIRIEHILLGEMPEGAYRELKRGEREELLRRAALPLVDYTPIVGEVVHWDGLGHTLGFATANVILANDILPDKTFTCRVTIDGEVFLGAGSYQVKKWHFEVHIIDFDRDIYGKILHVDIMDMIRDNRAFASSSELIAQITKDVNHVRAHWGAVLA
jgi:23S rRNA pseudouridine2605 synthase